MQTEQKHIFTLLFCLAVVMFTSTLSFAQSGDNYIHYLKQQAKKGSATEQYILGRKFIQGNITNQNSFQGLYWLEKAAQNHYVPATLFLGEIYEKGIGVERNYEQAIRWYKKAVKQGSESAEIKLASIINKDPGKEFTIYGISLQKANKLTASYALQNRGAKFLPGDSSQLCDRFRSKNLREGSDKVQVCYTPDNKIAYLEFRFPYTSGSPNHLQSIFQKLTEKYGDPEEPEDDSLKYVWKSKGVKIIYWYNARYNTAFLRYSLPQREKQFLKQTKGKNSTAE